MRNPLSLIGLALLFFILSVMTLSLLIHKEDKEAPVTLQVGQSLKWLIIILGLLFPVFAGVSYKVAFLTEFFNAHKISLSIILSVLGYLVFVFATSIIIVRNQGLMNLTNFQYIFIVLLLGFSIRYVYAILVNYDPTVGMQYLWFRGVKIAEVWEGIREYKSYMWNVLSGRALVYTAPVIYFFGKSYMYMKVANIMMVLVSSLICYDLTREWFGEKVGRCAFFLSVFLPETIWPVVRPYIEIPVILYLLISFWFLNKILVKSKEERYPSTLIYSVLLGCSLAAIELGKSLLIFWILGLIIFWVIRLISLYPNNINMLLQLIKQHSFRIFITLVIPLLIAKLILLSPFISKWAGSTSVKQNKIILWALGNGTSWATGNQKDAKEYYFLYKQERFRSLLQIVVSLEVSDFFYNPVEKVSNYFVKAGKRFFSAGGIFKYFNKKGLLPETKLNINQFRKVINLLNRTVALVLEIVFIVSLISVIGKGKMPQGLVFVLLFFAIYSFLLCFLGEVRPRYSLPMQYVFVAFFPLLFSEIGSKGFTKSLKRGFGFTIKSTLFIICFSGFVISSISCYAYYSDNKFLDLTEWKDISYNNKKNDDYNKLIRKIQPERHSQRHFRIVLQHKNNAVTGEKVAVSHVYDTRNSSKKRLSLYVHSWCETLYSPFKFQVIVNGVKRWDDFIECKKAVPVNISNINPAKNKIMLKFASELTEDMSEINEEDARINIEFVSLKAEP